MKSRLRYATLMTALIMAVFYTVSMILTSALLRPSNIDLTRFAMILGGLQIVLGLCIIRRMKRDGSYVPGEHRLRADSSLFSVKFIWVFIVMKFGAVYLMITDLQSFGDLRTPRWYELVLVLAFALTVGFFEEYLFRGLLFRNYLIALGDEKVVRAALLSALLFGLVHLDPLSMAEGLLFIQLPAAMVAGSVGFYLAATYYKTGKMIHVIILHTLFNLSTFLLAPFLSYDLLPGFPTLSILPIESGMGTYLSNITLTALFGFFGYRILKKTRTERLRAIESEAAEDREVQDVHLSTRMGTIETETVLGKDESCLD